MTSTIHLRPFQKQFIKAVESDRYDILGYSLPRGSGKSYLAGHLIARALTPGDKLFIGAGREVILVSGSIRQARIVYGFVRELLEPEGGYNFRHQSDRTWA